MNPQTPEFQPAAAKLDDATLDALMQLADERGELDAATRATLQERIAREPALAEAFDEQRRLRALLDEVQVPGLSDRQRRSLAYRLDVLALDGPPAQPRLLDGWLASLGLVIRDRSRAFAFAGAVACALLAAVVATGRLTDDKATDAASIPTPGNHKEAVAKAPDPAAAMASTDAAPAASGLAVHAAAGRIERLELASGSWQRLARGAVVQAGDRIRTPKTAATADAWPMLAFAGHAEVRLEPGTELAVLAMDGRDFGLRVRHGALELAVEKRQPDQRFAIFAGGWRASVVGTRFVVRHDGAATVGVDVSEGAVRVEEATSLDAAPGEHRNVVRAGHSWRSRSGRITFGPMVSEVQGHAQEETAPAAAVRARPRRATAKPGAKARSRRIVIEVPPQGMSADEIARIKQLEASDAPEGAATDDPDAQ